MEALDIRVLDDALVSRTEQVDSGTLVDLDERGNIVAIEVIKPDRSWPLDEILARFVIDAENAEVLRGFWGRSRSSSPPRSGAAATAGELITA